MAGTTTQGNAVSRLKGPQKVPNRHSPTERKNLLMSVPQPLLLLDGFEGEFFLRGTHPPGSVFGNHRIKSFLWQVFEDNFFFINYCSSKSLSHTYAVDVLECKFICLCWLKVNLVASVHHPSLHYLRYTS